MIRLTQIESFFQRFQSVDAAQGCHDSCVWLERFRRSAPSRTQGFDDFMFDRLEVLDLFLCCASILVFLLLPTHSSRFEQKLALPKSMFQDLKTFASPFVEGKIIFSDVFLQRASVVNEISENVQSGKSFFFISLFFILFSPFQI